MSEFSAMSVQIAKLEVSAGDVLVVKVDRHISDMDAKRFREHVTPHLPTGVKVLVLDCATSLSVLTQKEIVERTA